MLTAVIDASAQRAEPAFRASPELPPRYERLLSVTADARDGGLCRAMVRSRTGDLCMQLQLAPSGWPRP
jgi:hypothetical protein